MECIRKLQEADEGIFFPIVYTLLDVGQRLEVVLQRVQLDRCEAFLRKLVGLVGVSIITPKTTRISLPAPSSNPHASLNLGHCGWKGFVPYSYIIHYSIDMMSMKRNGYALF